MLLGLHMDSSPVTETDERDWVGECDRLLGVVPPPTAKHGGQVKLTWLYEQFTVPPITDVEAQQHAHAYILHMIGTQLFPDSPRMRYISDGYLYWKTSMSVVLCRGVALC